ncbi:acetoacetate--CoA ligase [Spirillospora sp. CA-255316]
MNRDAGSGVSPLLGQGQLMETDTTATVRPGQSPGAHTPESNLEDFQRWLRQVHGRDFAGYEELYSWSVADPAAFWSVLVEYFDVAVTGEREPALADEAMPGARWFPRLRLNYVEQVLRHCDQLGPAIIDESEAGGERRSITWAELRRQIGAVAGTFRNAGVGQGDVVVGYVPNVAEAMIAFLAAASLGAVWACCGQDFAAEAAAARLGQLNPTVLVTADGYRFAGKQIDKRDAVSRLVASLPSLKLTVVVPRLGLDLPATDGPGLMSWADASAADSEPQPVRVPFDHPLWVLFTSGTSGIPKGIVHGHGGVLLEHLKGLWLHWDMADREVFFWYTSPSWMLWNLQVGGLLIGATVVCYDGSPNWPAPEALWDVVRRNDVAVFGTSPAYLLQSEKAGLRLGEQGFAALRVVGATGSVVHKSAFRWVSAQFAGRVALDSVAGGTDVASAFAGPVPTLPRWEGELTSPMLGVALDSWDDAGRSVRDSVGELVVTKPMPSMPLFFWNDPDGALYRAAYFETWPGVWKHGDWITITGRGSVVFHGRSDATLNRNGVRMGSADIYAAVERLPEVAEALVIGVESAGGGYWMPLFVALVPGAVLDDPLRARIVEVIRVGASPRHVPDEIRLVQGIPHTRTGKRLEVPIKRLLQGVALEDVLDLRAVDDPSLLMPFIHLARERHQTAPVSPAAPTSPTTGTRDLGGVDR